MSPRERGAQRLSHRRLSPFEDVILVEPVT